MKFRPLLFLLTPLAVSAADIQYQITFDGAVKWSGRDAALAKPPVVYGASKYVDGVSGQGLDIRRHAYDQVTALICDKMPKFNTRTGTAAFWFKPHWNQMDPESHRIFCGNATRWRPFRFYLIKGKNGVIELTFAPSRQFQFLLHQPVFTKEKWSHVAFTWDRKTSSVSLYVDGKLLQRLADAAKFDFPDDQTDLVFQCGEGSDRFKANVGDGVYDDIRFYDVALSEDEIFAIASGGSDVKMKSVKLPGNSFRLSLSEPYRKSSSPIMRLKTAGGAKITLSAMGESRKLSLLAEGGGMTGKLECADTLRLDNGYVLSFVTKGKALSLYLDGALQGALELGDEVGGIVQAEAVEDVRIEPVTKRVLASAPMTEDEAALWTLDDAAKRRIGVRKGFCLNAFWRCWPVNDYLGAPPKDAPGYVRVPGSFRSPVWKIHQLKNGKIDEGSEYWQGKSILSHRAAWYERTIRLPKGKSPKGRIFVVFENFNADAGRIFWNGAQVKAFRQDAKDFTMVPNRVRVDVTDRLSDTGVNTLTLYCDRHYVGLWRGVPAIGDHGEIALGDVWLEARPDSPEIKSAVALPSWRRKEVTLRARIDNPEALAGDAVVRFSFALDGKGAKEFARRIKLDGSLSQVVKWKEPWQDPVAWTAENPRLYDMHVQLESDGAVIDTAPESCFGFREVWVENGEFFMNGEHLRMRMWTSPGLDRLRYYYGHPDCISQYVAMIKNLNYDTVRCNPWTKSSHVGIGEYLGECDRQGLMNLHQMPTYEDEDDSVYVPNVERFFEAYANHPSIILWYTDFNTCGYAWDQDPGKLTDTKYSPTAKKHARARAYHAEDTMRLFDDSRELFQHAGGNSGRIFTSMNYQSYGTPLQEQEDWPAQWAKGHTQPLMVVESAFPYPGQFQHFDKGGYSNHLAAEHAARYFGESVYAAERYPVPHSTDWVWAIDVASGEDANFRRLSDYHYRRVVKAWRGYNLSALGDFPGGRDHHHAAQTFSIHNTVYRRVPGDPKRPGLQPDNTFGFSEIQRHALSDHSRPDYQYATIRECFEPLLVFASGGPGNFTCKDHLYYSGEKIVKSLTIVNDHLYPVKVNFAWKAADQKSATSVEVPAGGIVHSPVEFIAPQVSAKTDVKIQFAWKSGEKSGRDELSVRIYPRPDSPESASVALLDPVGKTASLLRQAGVDFRMVTEFSQVKNGERLVIGQNAFASMPLAGALPENITAALVFEQPTNSLKRFIMAAPSYRDAFILRRDSPLLVGFDDDDFRDWRGESDTVPAYVISDENTPHYPRSKWKCGNGGIVAGCVIRRPSNGSFRTLVETGFNLQYAALLEERMANGGSAIWCQMDVTSRYGKDPAATLLVNRMLSIFGKTAAAGTTGRLYYDGDDADSQMLSRFGVKLPRWDGQSAGTVLVLPGSKEFSARRFDFRASLPKDAAFAGVSAADAYFRYENELPVEAFAVTEKDGVKKVRLGVRPDGSVKGDWNDEKIARVWMTVLGNLGVDVRSESPYFGKLEMFDGDAFHNW